MKNHDLTYLFIHMYTKASLLRLLKTMKI